MMMPLGEFNHLPEMAAQLPRIMRAIILKACFDLQARAQVYAPVRTGFMKSTIYVITHTFSSYGQNIEGEGPLNVPIETPPENEGWVVVGAEYGPFVEMGTSKMAAQPFMAPAAEDVEPSLQAAAKAVNDALAQVK